MADPPARETPEGPRPILVIVPLPPSYRGGTEEYAYHLVREYVRVRPVRVLTTTVRWNDGKDALEVRDVAIERLPAREVFERPVLRGRGAWVTLRRAVEEAYAVQLHMPFPLVERRVARWARRAGVPTVLTYHMDAAIGRHPERWLPRTIAWAYRRFSAFPAIRDASVVVSNSWGYARASPVLSRFLPKVRVVRKAIDSDRLRTEDTSAALPPRTPGVGRIVFVGRIVPYKGLPDLIAAAAELRRSGRKFELFIGGRGPQEAELRALVASLSLGDEVRFLGFVPDSAMGTLYRAADVVVCPSINLLESTPTALQEAMAVGTPVVGTTLPGTDETIPNDGRHGLLVPVHDVPALARAIGAMIDRGERNDHPPVPRWSDTAAEYLRLFDSLRSGGTGALPVGDPADARGGDLSRSPSS